MPDSKTDILAAEFRALLDESLVIAIASEQNLDDPTTYDAVRSTLQELAMNVPAEEATGFNHSGVFGAFSSFDGANDPKYTSTTVSNIAGSSTRDYDSSSTGITSPVFESNVSPVPRIEALEDSTDEEKAKVLQEMFADLKVHDVTLSLKKAKGNFQDALESMLNLQYLDSTGQRQKGIDGFFRPDEDVSTKKKKKGKSKRQKSAINSSSSSSVNEGGESGSDRVGLHCVLPERANKWAQAIEEMQFLAQRLGLHTKDISGDFYLNNCSTEKTLMAILDRYVKEDIRPADDTGKQNAARLSKKYGQVPRAYLESVAVITGDASERADDLARLLERHFAKPAPRKLDINYKLVPLADDEVEGYTTVPSSKSGQKGGVSGGQTSNKFQTYQAAMHVASSQAAASRQSYQAAYQAHKNGHSKNFLKQAAGYYADRAREEARTSAEARSAAADLLVSENSSADSIDLHGVEVADGVRIAIDRTWSWWRGLGEHRAQAAKEGFVVITGKGRHSAGGFSQLRTRVASALIRDGWKVIVETGRFRVTGRR